LPQLFFYFVGDSLNLAGIRAGTNDKVIGECAGSAVHFQNCQVFTFLALHCLDGLRNLLPGLLTHSLLPLAPTVRADGPDAKIAPCRGLRLPFPSAGAPV